VWLRQRARLNADILINTALVVAKANKAKKKVIIEAQDAINFIYKIKNFTFNLVERISSINVDSSTGRAINLCSFRL